LGLSLVALGIVFFVNDYREAGTILLWSGALDVSWLTSEPTSFLALLIVPIVAIGWVEVIMGKDSPALRKLAVLAGAGLVFLSVAQEFDNYIADQVYFGALPAALLSLAAFGSGAALGQSAIRSSL
jgi:hypothetical protein